jgi:hypothetical protein
MFQLDEENCTYRDCLGPANQSCVENGENGEWDLSGKAKIKVLIYRALVRRSKVYSR